MKTIKTFTAFMLAMSLMASGFSAGNKDSGSSLDDRGSGKTPPDKPREERSFSGGDPESSSASTVVVEGAECITYTYTSTRGVTKTYYAKYLVDGSSLDLTDQTIEASSSNEIAVLVVNGGKANLTNCNIIKGGDGAGATKDDDYNFYGINNAVVVLGEDSLATLSGCSVTTTGKYANAVFASDGGRVEIEDGITISTSSSSARGLFASYGGVVRAADGGVDISTQGIHCAALATDRGGGTIIVGSSESSKESRLSTVANDSPCIYSTGSIIGFNITGSCTKGQAVVVEGKNEVELTNCDLTGGRSEQGCVMLYQSSSGDAADEDASSTKSSLKAVNCKFTVSNGADMFVITHTSAAVDISGCSFEGIEEGQNFISCRKINWGTGAYLTMTAEGETLSGSVYTGDSSSKATISCGLSQLTKASGSSGNISVNGSAL